MNFSTRMVLVVTLMLAMHAGMAAQETSTAETTTAATTTTAVPASPALIGRSSYEIRGEFSQLLRQSPTELPTILSLDPTLLSSEPFLARYPDLARYVAANPQVRNNPRFYLQEFEQVQMRRGGLESILEPLMIFFVFSVITAALAWLVRTIIDQKRWNRLSRTQSEVHNKILDRFGTTAELLEYVKSPAGTKFLESAPIPLHSEPVTNNPSMTRVLWSIQIGVVVSAAAIGMLLVSARYSGETGQGLFAMGVIGLCIGFGFAGSAAVSIFLSRRLGLLQPAQTDEPGFVK
jgi:hypothetical protein